MYGNLSVVWCPLLSTNPLVSRSLPANTEITQMLKFQMTLEDTVSKQQRQWTCCHVLLIYGGNQQVTADLVMPSDHATESTAEYTL